jgi:hypothetical protein
MPKETKRKKLGDSPAGAPKGPVRPNRPIHPDKNLNAPKYGDIMIKKDLNGISRRTGDKI